MDERFTRAAAVVRIELAHESDFTLGPLEVRPSLREISCRGRHEIIDRRVMQVLVALARAQGGVISRDDLIASCWDGVVVGEDAITNCVRRLRKVAEAAGDAFMVETVQRVGYRLVGGEGQKSRGKERHQLSICVLPFTNLSGDVEQEYFSDGISEDVITDLSKVSALHVVSRNSSFAFKGKSIDVPKLARELNITHVLEGSVRKAGGRVRITAQLVNSVSNEHVWAERYDRDLKDTFALQDEIAEAIVRALKLTLLPEEKEGIGQCGTNSLEALRGNGTENAFSVPAKLPARTKPIRFQS